MAFQPPRYAAFQINPSPKLTHSTQVKKAKLLEPWGIVLGKYGKPNSKGPLLRVNADDYANILISGPPGAGKSTGIFEPTLLEYPGSAIVYDIKGELYESTARLRQSKGDDVFVFSPFNMELADSDRHGHDLIDISHSFNPLLEIKAIEDLENRLTALHALADNLLIAKTPQEDSLLNDGISIFVAVAAVLCHRQEKPTLRMVKEMLVPQVVEEGELPDIKRSLHALSELAPEQISKGALETAAAMDNKSLGIYISVLMGAGLKAWDEPAIIRATTENNISFKTMRSKPMSLYITIPQEYTEVSAPVVRLLFQTAVNDLMKKQPKRGSKFFPVLFMIDEFYSLGRLKRLVKYATTLRGYGGRLCLAVQTPANISDLYGREGAEIFKDTTQIKVWMTPNSLETMKHISDLLGNKTVASRSVSGKFLGAKSDQSHNYSEKGKPLMSPEEVGRMDKNKIIVTIQNQNPIMLDKVVSYKDTTFKDYYEQQFIQKMAWPDVPKIKDGPVTRKADVLRPVSPVQEVLQTQERDIADLGTFTASEKDMSDYMHYEGEDIRAEEVAKLSELAMSNGPKPGAAKKRAKEEAMPDRLKAAKAESASTSDVEIDKIVFQITGDGAPEENPQGYKKVRNILHELLPEDQLVGLFEKISSESIYQLLYAAIEKDRADNKEMA